MASNGTVAAAHLGRTLEAARPPQATATVARSVLATARAELGISRPLGIFWYRREPPWPAGAYSRDDPTRIMVAIDVGDELEYVVRHEAAHAAGFAEIECAYFGLGIRPIRTNGHPTLPSDETLTPEQWPAELWPPPLLEQIAALRDGS